MSSVFEDTSAWYALADRGDTYNAAATRRLRRLVGERTVLVTTNHVIAETYTLLRGRLGFGPAQAFLTRTQTSALTRRVFVPEAWEDATEDLLRQYSDQEFSYVDATSFVAMRRLRLGEAFTFDHHFAVAGFVLLAD
jgi:uncharacterized protein